MAMKDLPRPWLLAALTDVPITELARLDADEARQNERDRWLPRRGSAAAAPRDVAEFGSPVCR